VRSSWDSREKISSFVIRKLVCHIDISQWLVRYAASDGFLVPVSAFDSCIVSFCGIGIGNITSSVTPMSILYKCQYCKMIRNRKVCLMILQS